MRKELVTYVKTLDEEEFSVQSVATDRNFVIINNNGNKFTAKVEELKAAIQAIEEFDKANNGVEVGNS